MSVTTLWKYAPTAIGLAVVALVVAKAATAAQDHRQRADDPARMPGPTVDQKLTDPVLAGAVDMHMHSDPDSYLRSVDAFEAASLAKARGLRGIVLKNHFSQTAGLAYLVRKQVPGLEVFGGIALNTPVGGLNAEAVRHMTEIHGGYGKVVWLPTHDSEQEVNALKEKRPFVAVSRRGKLLPEVLEILDLIAKHDLVLATGHVSANELFLVLRAARERNVKRILVTHPRLGEQFTFLSVPQMQEAAKGGAYLEFVSSFAFGDRSEQKTREVAGIIRAVGPATAIVSSDTGLAGTPLHTDALALAARALRSQGFAEADLNRMFKENPARLLGLP
jgi:hypothetical protein